MTQDEAETEAARRQGEDGAATFKAVAQADAWVVVRLPLPPRSAAAGTATKPPPTAPQEGPPEREFRAGLWGTG